MTARPAPRVVGFSRALLCVLGGIVSLSCGQDSATDPDGPSARVAAVRVTPDTQTVEEGASVTLEAIVLDAAGHALNGRPVAWTVSDTAVAAVSTSGTVAGRRAGTVAVAATVGGVVGSARVTVAPAHVASVTLALLSTSIHVSDTTVAVASVLDAHGNVLTGRRVTFASTDSSVAMVSERGIVTGTGIGVATISAASGDATARTELSVAPPPVARMAIAPGHATVFAGGSFVITAFLRDEQHRRILGSPIRYTTSDPGVATVSATGLVTGVARGSAVITTTSDTKTATTSVSVLDPTDGNWAHFDSDPGDRFDPGDWVGQGDVYTYTAANAAMNVGSHGTDLGVRIIGNDRQEWVGRIALPSALIRLQPGTYQLGWPAAEPAGGSMDWYYSDRGCNTVTGSVTIDSVRYVGDLLAAIDFSFVQHCDDDVPALRGTIHWRADLAPPPPALPPGPINPIPADLWAPPTDRVPSSGNWVYFESDSGDWLGQGQTFLYVWPNDAIDAVDERATVGDGFATVGISGPRDVWGVSLQAPVGFRELAPGYYPGVLHYGSHDPARGGLDVGGLYRSCIAITGWFAVDSASYSGDTLTALDARFEQHCEGARPALRGAVRWRLATMLPASHMELARDAAAAAAARRLASGPRRRLIRRPIASLGGAH